MSMKVSWGTMLDPAEIADREKEWEKDCVALEADVLDLLRGHDFTIKMKHIKPVCTDCPAKECHVCMMDAAMSDHLSKPGLEITLYRER